MRNDKYIEVQGKNYVLLGMYGGNAHLGLLYDLNNDVYRSGVIWYMQPFEYKSKFFTWRMNLARTIIEYCIKSKDWSKQVKRASRITDFIYKKNKYYIKFNLQFYWFFQK